MKPKSFCAAKQSSVQQQSNFQNGKKSLSPRHLTEGVQNIQRMQTKNKPNLKWSIKLNREISKQVIQRANKYIFKHSISLAIRDMQTKTTLRFHLTPIKITMILFLRTTNADVCVKRRNTFTAGGSTNWCFHYVTQCEVPQKARNSCTIRSSFSISAYSQRTLYSSTEIPAHQYLLLLQSQKPERGNSLDVHQVMNR